jgi:hypothetical protein
LSPGVAVEAATTRLGSERIAALTSMFVASVPVKKFSPWLPFKSNALPAPAWSALMLPISAVARSLTSLVRASMFA